jgi:hypothetical protein
MAAMPVFLVDVSIIRTSGEAVGEMTYMNRISSRGEESIMRAVPPLNWGIAV